MAYEFLLPDIGEGLHEATILQWYAKVGDHLDADAPMVEVETDKAITEIPAPRAGVLLYQGAAIDDVIEVGRILAVIGEAGEQWAPGAAAVAPAESADAAPIVGTLDSGAETLAPVERPPVLPQVRKLAEARGVDLAAVAGTGPGGRVTAEDVEAAVAGTGPVERVALSPTRRAIAEHMTRSWREIPHVTTYGEADGARLLDARRRLAEQRDSPVPIEALLVAAVVPVLREEPEFNAAFQDDHVLLRHHYDIGFAVDTADGLMVAVIRGAGDLGVLELADEIARLADRVRSRTADAAELRGATFTISNIGAVGGGYGTPIIPYGTTAILSVGRASPRAVARGEEVAVATMLPLSLSYDHRVIDGAAGRRFMGRVAAAIEAL